MRRKKSRFVCIFIYRTGRGGSSNYSRYTKLPPIVFYGEVGTTRKLHLCVYPSAVDSEDHDFIVTPDHRLTYCSQECTMEISDIKQNRPADTERLMRKHSEP